MKRTQMMIPHKHPNPATIRGEPRTLGNRMTDNTKKKIHVAVLMGGKSHEHGISVLSGKAVFNNLDK